LRSVCTETTCWTHLLNKEDYGIILLADKVAVEKQYTQAEWYGGTLIFESFQKILKYYNYRVSTWSSLTDQSIIVRALDFQ